jgi:hypothetical protein
MSDDKKTTAIGWRLRALSKPTIRSLALLGGMRVTLDGSEPTPEHGLFVRPDETIEVSYPAEEQG